jgi:hypothetical protein
MLMPMPVPVPVPVPAVTPARVTREVGTQTVCEMGTQTEPLKAESESQKREVAVVAVVSEAEVQRTSRDLPIDVRERFLELRAHRRRASPLAQVMGGLKAVEVVI